ncbi:MAG: protease [Candidatus Solibacter sp.]|nr:protease [Candidatus Solibacter sp.]
MAPAGYWRQLHAAVEAGADAVYFGLKHFTARAKVGFSIDELPEAMRTLHRRGVRGFVTFNTLIFDHEIGAAAKALARIAEAGADAVIVQDAGILKLARRIAPELEIHASTQMSVTDTAGARRAAALGASRVTLARELSIKEIGAIAAAVDVELEVFVHGALCVAYSGQCFSSEAWGGRSANRGLCAQACRMPYEMLVDGVLKPLGDARYLLSPNDLFALNQVPELMALGLAAFKIEGRYKEADYVAAATSAYRRAVDDAWAGRALTVSEGEKLDLEQVYSRGMGAHFVNGTNHQTVVTGRTPRHRGVLMGEVVRTAGAGVIVRTGEAHRVWPLKAGDGVVFDAADWRSPQEEEEGGRVFEALEAWGGLLELRFRHDAIRMGRIRAGDLVWRTDDPAVEKRLRKYTQAASPVTRQRVDVTVRASVGEALETRWQVGATAVMVRSNDALGAARERGLTVDALREQLGRLGGTAYELGELTLEMRGQAFAPVSALNQMRREAVAALEEMQGRRPVARVEDPEWAAAGALRFKRPEVSHVEARLHLLVRTAEQLDAAIEAGPESVTLDYLDLYGLRPSVERVVGAGLKCRVASPRVLKPGEEKMADFLVRLGCPILVRPAGLIEMLRGREGVELTGDFSLNAANALTARMLLDDGLERLTPTHDLNAEQVAALARAAGADRIEAVAYHHLPVFHTEHCVFCRFLSTGTTYEDCGRPCEKHRVELRDEKGRSHPVLADVGCRNTVFGAEAQEASLHMKPWLEAGIRHYRLEFAHETAEQVAGVAGAFKEALAGWIDYRELGARLKRAAPQGVTQGSLFVSPGYLELPVLE